MGYSYRNNGAIKDFWPDDTDTEFYIVDDESLETIIEMCQTRWPDAKLSDIKIESEYIHTRCVTYDLYDFMDWTRFLKISLK